MKRAMLLKAVQALDTTLGGALPVVSVSGVSYLTGTNVHMQWSCLTRTLSQAPERGLPDLCETEANEQNGKQCPT
jgi:hypothetical protein